jgi:hypothetical protein
MAGRHLSPPAVWILSQAVGCSPTAVQCSVRIADNPVDTAFLTASESERTFSTGVCSLSLTVKTSALAERQWD